MYIFLASAWRQFTATEGFSAEMTVIAVLEDSAKEVGPRGRFL